MRFSIIATGYNGARYVEKCLQSIKDQTLQPYEVILVDDGSTDGSFKQMQKYAGEFWQLHQFKENKGTYYARDFAISKAKGDVIVMVDMDDYLMPYALEMCLKEYNKGVLMTYGNYMFLDGSICPVNMNYSEEIHENRDYRKDTWRCTHLRTFVKSIYEHIPKWDLTKAEIDSYPDAEILFSMMEMCGYDRIGVITEPIYVYNTANSNGTLNRFGKNYPGYYEICNRPKRELI